MIKFNGFHDTSENDIFCKATNCSANSLGILFCHNYVIRQQHIQRTKHDDSIIPTKLLVLEKSLYCMYNLGNQLYTPS